PGGRPGLVAVFGRVDAARDGLGSEPVDQVVDVYLRAVDEDAEGVVVYGSALGDPEDGGCVGDLEASVEGVGHRAGRDVGQRGLDDMGRDV
ncbi:MAG: hypothetical protein Q9211_007138, partial [Gyalolechia sp. 1 TL-2023]